ncbi:twin-arginine translocase subunit TatC [Caldinitratiruptor microaerophilus]|uniref:Sec-independent protein translocase protein TatC n=1 Tax=Caldinitratiruptor microaerophilus TaxID=671077 RepID=A0AA35CIM7_9FIRM|nr:twin-arginine translocase subunit TatC [Caldinitratiruptor microaerophilus]BDG59154.1 Sec-independent protein translocase protein TatC [Caldinitratiruptor microaerophilus]
MADVRGREGPAGGEPEEHAAAAPGDRPAPVMEHLEELRRRIIWSLVAVAIGVAVGWVFVGDVFRLLMRQAPLPLQSFGPAEVFVVQFRMGALAGLVLASPVVLYQIIAFVLPALTPTEKRWLFSLLPATLILFVLGVLFGYLVLLPMSLRFFLYVAETAGTPVIFTVRQYFDLIIKLTVPLGVVFELPVVVWLLAQIGLVSSAMLGRLRKYAVVGIFVVAAVISPGTDVVSQVIMAVPLLALYEAGIWIAYLVERRKRARG